MKEDQEYNKRCLARLREETLPLINKIILESEMQPQYEITDIVKPNYFYYRNKKGLLEGRDISLILWNLNNSMRGLIYAYSNPNDLKQSKIISDSCFKLLKEDVLPKIKSLVADINYFEGLEMSTMGVCLGYYHYENDKGEAFSVRLDTHLITINNTFPLLIDAFGGNVVADVYKDVNIEEVIDLEELE